MCAKLKYLVFHCSDTPNGREVTREDLEQWHLKENGWSRLGYSDIIHLDGRIENLIPYDDDDIIDAAERSNGVGKKVDGEWVNAVSRHCVIVGGRDKSGNHKDTRTKAQRIACTQYARNQVAKHPDLMIAGHYQFDNLKPFCPGFDTPQWGLAIGLSARNIYLPQEANH